MIGRSMLLSGWVLIFWVLSQVLPITHLVYHPIQVQVANGQVSMYRSFPLDRFGLPRPIISYEETIRPLTPTHNRGHSCTERGGPFKYDRATSIGVWDISWAEACTSDPAGYTWSATWFWHIGTLRMGPVSHSKSIVKKQAILNSYDAAIRRITYETAYH